MYKQCIKLLPSIFLKCLELFSAMKKPGFRERELHGMPEVNTGFTYGLVSLKREEESRWRGGRPKGIKT